MVKLIEIFLNTFNLKQSSTEFRSGASPLLNLCQLLSSFLRMLYCFLTTTFLFLQQMNHNRWSSLLILSFFVNEIAFGQKAFPKSKSNDLKIMFYSVLLPVLNLCSIQELYFRFHHSTNILHPWLFIQNNLMAFLYQLVLKKIEFFYFCPVTT